MDGGVRIIFQLDHGRVNKAFIFILIVIMIISFFKPVFALTIYPGVEFEVENEIYTVNHVMDFSSITISDTFIIFNTTGFYIDSPNDITISLEFINSSINQASNGDLVLQFYADTTSGNVLFDISGFPPGNEYEIHRDGNPISTPIANSSGFIFFSNNIWSNHEFSVYQIAFGSDVISPEISNIVLTTSNPLDTDPGFGWENISCVVTDNIDTDEVKINIEYPDNTVINISMNHHIGTDIYYYNTSFSQYGDYSYFIWAQDTSTNANTSDTGVFSLPPNWDINMDGQCKVIDLMLVSNHYDEVGSSGWIREDVNNDGEVNILDLIQISNFYNEIW